jgi:hypothetical protein
MTEAGFRMLSPVWFVFLLAIAGNSAGLQPRVFGEAAEVFSDRRSPARQIRVLQ